MRDLLEPATREVLVIEPAHDRSLRFVHGGERVLSAGAVGPAVELVAVATSTGDLTVADARAQRLASSRTDRLQLHLMAGALDEGSGLIDRVREEHFLTAGVVVEPAPAIADQIADDESHLDRVATKARLIAADDDIAALRLGEQLSEARAREEVIAAASVVHIIAPRLLGEPQAHGHLAAPGRLDVEAELLLPLVVLGPPAIGSNHHRGFPPLDAERC